MDRSKLAALIGREYGLDLASIQLLPRGEDAFNYLAEARDGRRFVVRVQKRTRGRQLEPALAVASALHVECGLWQVVAARRNRHGRLTCPFGSYTIAVFPRIEGATAEEKEISEDSLRQVASLIAAVHASAGSISVPLPYTERFENPFVDPILRAFRAVENPRPEANDEQSRLRDLLRAHETDIQYRWALQEIADYATRLLFGSLDPIEREHAWASLVEYLPIPRERIQRDVEETIETIA